MFIPWQQAFYRKKSEKVTGPDNKFDTLITDSTAINYNHFSLPAGAILLDFSAQICYHKLYINQPDERHQIRLQTEDAR
jgi:hypothetical protein